jgi:hypothetical protein
LLEQAGEVYVARVPSGAKMSAAEPNLAVERIACGGRSPLRYPS